MELILKVINDTQKEIMDTVNEKVKGFAEDEKVDQIIKDLDGSVRRVQNVERGQSLINEKIDEQASKTDSNRKIGSRNTNDIEQLKMDLKTARKNISQQTSFVEPTPITVDDDEGGDGDGVSKDALSDVIKQIQRMERNFLQRISEVEKYGSKFVSIQDAITELQDNMTRALAPKGPHITEDDVKNWNQNIEKSKDLEDQIKQLRKDMNMLDGPKIKADILQLFKITQKLVSEDDISGMKDDLRRVKSDVADCNYDVTACKDIVQKSEKQIDTNQKANV